MALVGQGYSSGCVPELPARSVPPCLPLQPPWLNRNVGGQRPADSRPASVAADGRGRVSAAVTPCYGVAGVLGR